MILGYHTMGCLGFDALRRHGFEVAAVLTHPDDPREEIWWDSLAARAGAAGVPVHFPESSEGPEASRSWWPPTRRTSCSPSTTAS